ncbi:toxin-antitoxin system YwqK family antitoxin [Porphyromonas levii]|uniref:toxin-antitoxin system YwqK family antitoxin n=1 Tax=Porphyromonas levii TaxID=28114 RepID=UPI001BACA218|nr:toxin-antitoxin system YwqK family antitoxin [Porphyromonas levii]
MSEQVATKRVLETVDIWLRRDLDLSEEDKMSFLTYISPMRNVNALLTGRWFSKSVVRVPEDQPKIDEAVEIARRAKVDPMSYDSPMSLIEAFKKYKLREGAVNPDTVPELSNKREIGYGITVYDVDDTPEGQLAMRRIVDTHFGEDANPWCLLQGDGDGGVTDAAWDYWQHYDGCEKKVAFENGKLIAFCANEDYDDLWWDRQDKSHDGVPLLNYLIPDDELGRSADLVIGVCGEVVAMTDIHKGNRQNGLYERWHENGQLSERCHYQKGNKEGLEEFWSHNGKLLARHTYRNGMQDGLSEGWHSNGQLFSRGNYKDGKLNGLYERWHKNGQLEERFSWRNGRRDGFYERWHENGRQKERSNWEGGMEHGLYERWHENGQPWIRCTYKEGKLDGLYERWHENGQLEERSSWRNGGKHGLYERWRDDGQQWERSNWRDDRKHGLCEKLRDYMEVDSVIYDMGKEVSRQILNDFTPVGASIQAGKKEKHLNILSPKRKRGRSL